MKVNSKQIVPKIVPNEKKTTNSSRLFLLFIDRGGKIRTCDLTVPDRFICQIRIYI